MSFDDVVHGYSSGAIRLGSCHPPTTASWLRTLPCVSSTIPRPTLWRAAENLLSRDHQRFRLGSRCQHSGHENAASLHVLERAEREDGVDRLRSQRQTLTIRRNEPARARARRSSRQDLHRYRSRETRRSSERAPSKHRRIRDRRPTRRRERLQMTGASADQRLAEKRSEARPARTPGIEKRKHESRLSIASAARAIASTLLRALCDSLRSHPRLRRGA